MGASAGFTGFPIDDKYDTYGYSGETGPKISAFDENGNEGGGMGVETSFGQGNPTVAPDR